MTGHVYWMFDLAIKDGEYEKFEALMKEMVEATEANEPGALNYEWSVSEDKKTCHILERYVDSAATMVHMGNFGKNFGRRFMEVLKPNSITLYGDPSEEVVKAFSAMGPVIMNSVGGFSR
ncbi:putative quinol monooxygenase [Sneathiella sp. HT1-7]|uniref:putative quinol monooxygenase n=1 Tax=Sneathiella sp. HT1-7 TaxID=2887192 RepID=UPI001D15D7DA|nr:antibiotic biosynthesis monooxygenase [Sneathiella sp. HT1-7]MCC3305452.1 antibiotic biosynthesis monooxygenase [Sneathiella sp. HT1-7]